jgi:hypothetical protein
MNVYDTSRFSGKKEQAIPMLSAIIKMLLYRLQLECIDKEIEYNIVISSQGSIHNGSLLHSEVQYTTVEYSTRLF